ncbi:hypothetical protein KDA_69720 [Dictyobacter alpinus]|uniref:Uncharacterized protein n=1 Tax=Dictyobacter alpinus TaxID=2014873 RepID=A0A402BJG3_9CHLR|nr:hypothetical protein KDA_69720 [Dictyobacter alpinus]
MTTTTATIVLPLANGLQSNHPHPYVDVFTTIAYVSISKTQTMEDGIYHLPLFVQYISYDSHLL